MTTRPYFRPHPTPAPRNWPLLAIAALAIFDAALVGYVLWQLAAISTWASFVIGVGLAAAFVWTAGRR